MTANKTKTYRAENINEALLKVKLDLGKNAVIEEQRQVKQGGFLGFFQQSLVEVDAKLPATQNFLGDRNNRRSLKKNTSRKQNGGNREWNLDTPAAPDFSPRSHAARLIDQKLMDNSGHSPTYKSPRKIGVKRNFLPAQEGGDSTNNGVKMSPKNIRTLEKVLANTDLLSEKVERLAEKINSGPGVGTEPCYPGSFNDVYNTLLKNGVKNEYARELIGRTRRLLEPHEIEDKSLIKEKVFGLVDEDFHEAPPLINGNGKTVLVPFVGPTGVGKTTTVAKLAAHFFGEEGKSVGFIAMDHFRLAAVDQLATYADIMGAPLEDLEESSDDFKKAVDSLVEQQVDIIFIDTAGRSQFDSEKINSLRTILDTDYRVIPHLVVSATSRCDELETVVDAFSAVDFERVVVTKLDETCKHGMIYNLLKKIDYPISYFTNGQEVPGYLEMAESSRLAELIMAEED
ncbi:MAG: flagellar biosynthesis protein FlhF [bacterium]